MTNNPHAGCKLLKCTGMGREKPRNAHRDTAMSRPMRALVVLVFLQTTIALAEPPPRAKGRGFTVVLLNGWREIPVDDDKGLELESSDGLSSLVVTPTTGVLDAADCTRRARDLAAMTDSTPASSVFQKTPWGRICRIEVNANGASAYYIIRDEGTVHLLTCVAPMETDFLAIPVCEAALTTWRDYPDSRPRALEHRIAIDRSEAGTFVGSPYFRMTFPKGWRVGEGNGAVLVTASKPGLVVLLGVSDTSLTTMDIRACVSLAAPRRDGGKILSYRLEAGPSRPRCKLALDLVGMVGYTFLELSNGGKVRWLDCVTTKTAALDVACAPIVDQWSKF